jgi:hypothetical protein
MPQLLELTGPISHIPRRRVARYTRRSKNLSDSRPHGKLGGLCQFKRRGSGPAIYGSQQGGAPRIRVQRTLQATPVLWWSQKTLLERTRPHRGWRGFHHASPPRKKVILQNEPNEPEPRRFCSRDTISPPTSVVIPSGHARCFVALPTLWHCNGTGIGFRQRSCKAKARCVASFCPRGTSGNRMETPPWLRLRLSEE